jgi:hypothetical protein
VCHIEHDLGPSRARRDHLKSPGPARFADATLNRFRSDPSKSLLAQLLGCRDRERHIAQLMTAYQRGLHKNLMPHHEKWIPVNVRLSSLRGSFRELRVGRLLATRNQVLGTSGRNRRHIRHCAHRPRSKFQNRVADHVVGLGLLWQRHHHTARPEDPHFFTCNLADRVTEKLLVIERDVSNHADPRLHNVGGIEPPAHAHFEHRDLHAFSRKMLEGDRGHHLEKTGMPREFSPLHQLLGGSIHFAMKPGEIVVADLLLVHPDALVDAHQMRRSV